MKLGIIVMRDFSYFYYNINKIKYMHSDTENLKANFKLNVI